MDKKAQIHIEESERAFRSLAENSPDLIARVDREGRYIYVNQRLANSIGKQQAEVIGKLPSELGIPVEIAEQWQTACEKVFETGEIATDEFIYPNQRYFHARLAPEFDDDGQVVTVLSVTRDITERIEMEKAYQRSEQRHRRILEALPDMLVKFDKHGNYVDVIPASEFDPPLPPDQLIGKNIYDVRRPTLAEGAIRDIHEVLQSGEARDVEYQIGKRHFEARLMPFEDDHVMAIIRDITSRRHAESRLVALTQQEERIRVMQRFMEKAAHDILTPLTILRTNLYLMMRTTDDPKTLRRVELLEDQTAHIEDLMRDLLKLGQMNRDSLTLEPHDLNQIIQQTITQRQIATQHIIRLDGDSKLPNVKVDPNEFRFVIDELLNNSLAYSQPEHPITIQTRLEGDDVIVKVIDQGEGIEEKDLPHIFEPFHRAFERSTTKGGFGLGLTIVDWIVTAHNGKIEIESTVGQGTTVTIRLPL